MQLLQRGAAGKRQAAKEDSGTQLLQTGAAGKRQAAKEAEAGHRSDPPKGSVLTSTCWNKGWEAFKDPERRDLIYLMHIPKTAACSLINDLDDVVGRENIFSSEYCYSTRELHDFRGVVSILRSPRPHVLGQYVECTSGYDWSAAGADREKVPARFDDFVSSWARWHELGNISGHWSYNEDPFTCYRPVSLQVQRYTCNGMDGMHDFPQYLDVKGAVENMMNTEYLGLVEAYQESVCLIRTKLTGALPSFCDCRDEAVWGSFQVFNETHKVEPHNIEDYSDTVLADIDAITYADRELYRAGVERFQRDVLEVEQQFGTKILCRDLKEDPALQYVLAPVGA